MEPHEVEPHEVEPWFHSWYRGRVEILDAKYKLLAYINSTLCSCGTNRELLNTRYDPHNYTASILLLIGPASQEATPHHY